jgi:hypothetical protein
MRSSREHHIHWHVVDDDDNNINNNSVQFFIIYVPSQQPQGQLQTLRTVDTGNYIMDKYNMKSKINYRQAVEGEK